MSADPPPQPQKMKHNRRKGESIMEMNLHIAPFTQTRRTPKQLAAAVKKAAGSWRSGAVEEAVELLNGVFNESVPDPAWFRSPVKEFGGEFRDLVSKLYLLHAKDKDDEYTETLLEFEEACGGGLVGGIGSGLVGSRWEEVRELFYEKCPECMFLGDADAPYSLKLRSEGCIECIPEDPADLHELSSPADDYAHAMDGYSFYEGYALVRDDPGAKQTECPSEIRAILRKIRARKLKYFPNVIFPLVEGEDLLDSCRQMLDLLKLLDYGYRFESISRYVTDHPDLVPGILKKRLQMLLPEEDDEPEDAEDDELEFPLDDLKDSDDDEAAETAAGEAPPVENELPPEPDAARLAEDRARGIEFGADGRTLEKYPSTLTAAEYEIPCGVTRIREEAFAGCKRLRKVVIPEGVTAIERYAFKDCEKLETATLPASLSWIGPGANCRSLTDATIPEGVVEIGDYTFSTCLKLTKLTLPRGVRTIGSGAFSDCDSLTSVKLPESVVEIGDHAFGGCGKLTEITIPPGVGTIREWTFHGCERLKSVNLPEGVEAIGEWAFADCRSLTSVELPSSLATIGEHAFGDCGKLRKVTLPEGVAEIGKKAFSMCESLTSVELPSSVSVIRYQTFFFCSKLDKVTLPEGVKAIESKAFAHCKKLTGAELPASVRFVESQAFVNCPCEAELKKKRPELF